MRGPLDPRLVLGLNARNAHIARVSSRHAIAGAKDKAATKRRLTAAGVPVPPTLAELDHARTVRRFAWRELPNRWVMKPSRGSRGRGVLVVTGARGGSMPWWELADGRTAGVADLARHAEAIIDGEHSDGQDDMVLVEPLLVSHPDLRDLAPEGLPDIRVICAGDRALMAMMRIPTNSSGGRGNLHQGGLGASIDLATGRIERAVVGGETVVDHPDTGARVVGRAIPSWADVVAAAEACSAPTGLGYVGVDVVVDADRGALVLEVNSHPGLEIQNVTGRGLAAALRDRSAPTAA